MWNYDDVVEIPISYNYIYMDMPIIEPGSRDQGIEAGNKVGLDYLVPWDSWIGFLETFGDSYGQFHLPFQATLLR